MARWVSHRTDQTAKALIAHALSLGCKYHGQDGTIDGVLWLPDGRLVEVDWKSPKGELTPAQAKLVASGWHQIRFISDVAQLEALVRSAR
jgi:hypothetical protein